MLQWLVPDREPAVPSSIIESFHIQLVAHRMGTSLPGLQGKRCFIYQELQRCTKLSFNTPYSRKNPVKLQHRDSKLLFRISTKSCGKRRAQPKSSAVCAFGAGIHHQDSLASAMLMVLMHRASVSLLSICPVLPEQAGRAVDTGSAPVTHLVNYLEPDDLIERAECSRPIS